MAPLTWRNVNAPNLSPAAAILAQASTGIQDGFNNLSGVIQDARNRQITERSNEGIGRLAEVGRAADVDAALASVLGSVAAKDRNSSFNTAIENLRGNALGYDQKRADIRRTNVSTSNAAAQNARTQLTFDRNIQREDQEYALAQEYANLLRDGVGIPPVQSGVGENNPSQTGELTNPQIADILPENSMFTFNEMTGFIDRHQFDQERQKSNNDKALYESVQNDVYRMVQELGPNALQEGKQIILNSDMTAKEKELSLTALQNIVNNNSEYFQGTGGSILSAEEQNMVENLTGGVEDYNNVATTFDPDVQSLLLLNAANSENGGEGSDPTTSTGSTGTQADQLSALWNQFETEDGNILVDLDSIARITQQVAESTGLPIDLVTSMVPRSLNNSDGYSDRMSLDKDALMRSLSGVLNEKGQPDQSKIIRLLSEQRMREQFSATAQLLRSELGSIDEEYSLWASRPDTPENRQRLASLQNRKVQIINQLQSLNDNARAAAGITDNTTTEGENTTNMRAQNEPPEPVVRLEPGAVTPSGRQVDPGSSRFSQDVNSFLIEDEIKRKLFGIQGSLTRGGGSTLNQFLGGMVDYFRPADVAEQNAEDRSIKGEALEWFKSNEAKNIFLRDPLLLTEAEEDPVKFYQKYKEK